MKNLAVILGVAAVVTVLFQKLRQPVVLGYILAGLIIGPHIPIPLVADEKTIHTLSELGVILLLFWLGLEFRIQKLFRIGATAGPITLLQCSFMLWLGYVTGQAFGWTPLESLYAGGAIAISSTTIIFKAFEELRLRGKLTEVVFGILIFEDLVAILLLAGFTSLSSGENLSFSQFGMTAVQLLGFLGVLGIAGYLLVPPFMRVVVRLQRPETTLVASIGICFLCSLLAYRFGYSVALGAFLAGTFIAESGEKHQIENVVRPVRDMFAAIFFVSVGMMIDPKAIADHWIPIVVFTAVVVAGKVLSISVASFLTGYGTRFSIQAGMSLAQIGEFSYIIVALGLTLGAAGNFLYSIVVAVSAITTLLTPWLIRISDPVAAFIDRKLPKPVQTFACLYGSWLEKLRSTPARQSQGSRVRRWIRFLALDVVILLTLVITSSVMMPKMTARLAEKTGLSDPFARALGIIAVMLLCAPFVVGIFRCVRSLGFTLATMALPKPGEGAVDSAAAPRRAFIVTLQLILLLAVVAPLVAITQPFLPTYPGLTLVVLLLILVGIIFWRRAANLEGHVQAGAQMIGEALARRRQEESTQGGGNSLQLVQNMLPGMGSLYSVRLEPGSHAIGKTLGELRLRGLTGASVLALTRNGDVMIPQAQDSLEEGDVLALTGTHEATEAAQRLLVEGKFSP